MTRRLQWARRGDHTAEANRDRDKWNIHVKRGIELSVWPGVPQTPPFAVIVFGWATPPLREFREIMVPARHCEFPEQQDRVRRAHLPAPYAHDPRPPGLQRRDPLLKGRHAPAQRPPPPKPHASTGQTLSSAWISASTPASSSQSGAPGSRRGFNRHPATRYGSANTLRRSRSWPATYSHSARSQSSRSRCVAGNDCSAHRGSRGTQSPLHRHRAGKNRSYTPATTIPSSGSFRRSRAISFVPTCVCRFLFKPIFRIALHLNATQHPS